MFKIAILFFLIIVCSSIGVLSQESFKSIQAVEYTINADNSPISSNKRQILTSLSINNIKNIHFVKLNFKTDILLNVRRDDQGHLFAYVKAIEPKVTGDIHFRDFLIDSLLIPVIFDGKLIVKVNGDFLQEIPIEMLLTGGVIDLEILEKLKLNIEELSFEVKIEKLLYSDQQLCDFMNKANSINSYYSYNKVLNLLIKRYNGNQLNRGSSSAETFIAWHHINRVSRFIETHNFKEDLKIESYDPLGLLSKTIQLSRLKERASTLFTKELEKGKRGKLLDRNTYCEKYVGISMDYIALSKRYQPNTVSAFNELVSIFPIDEDLKRIVGVSTFYDVFKITNVPTTSQLIYNMFVSSADSILKRQEYLNTLNLIRNANEIEVFFDQIQNSEKFYEVYAGALSGLMNSFLKVSVMAYKSKNFMIAKRYYQQAQQLYDENVDFVGSNFKIKQSFQEFVESQFDLAQVMVDNAYFEDAIELLDQAKTISEKNQLEISSTDFDAEYKKGYSGIYNILVDSIEYYIEQENKSNSLAVLLHSAKFEQSHMHYLDRDERVSTYANILFDYYMNTGLQKLQANKPDEAIRYLSEARNLDDLFQMNQSGQIDSVLSLAIVPEILQKIKKAEFEVWAKRLEEANKIKKEAEILSAKYGLVDHEVIQQALLNLEEKIVNRRCVDIQYKVNNACKMSVNRVHAHKIKEAEIILNKAVGLINTNPACDIMITELDSLVGCYQSLFRYVENKDSLFQIIGATGFFDIKRIYDDLHVNYTKNGLNDYIIEIPSLQELMRRKGSITAYFEAAHYYIDQKEYLNAFYYLDMLKVKKVDARDTKSLQKTIGYEICKDFEDKRSFIFDLTKEDPWYKVLNTNCLKN